MRPLVLTVVAFMALCLSANAQITIRVIAAQGTCGKQGGNLTWVLEVDTITGDNPEIIISGNGEMKDWGEWTPSGYTGSPWDSLNVRIEMITIGDGVTSIGEFAFTLGAYVHSIYIGSSVKKIGYEAFRRAGVSTHGLSINIPNSVDTIGDAAFLECWTLTSVSFGNSLKYIGNQAFEHCSDLTSVTIPNNVTYIGGYAFRNCINLKSVSISNSVKEIRTSTFQGCNSLTSVSIPNSVETIENHAFTSCNSLTSVNIPASVTSIEFEAFRYCTGLTSVIINGALSSTEICTFRDCSNLTTVNMPNAVVIAGEMFMDCPKLNSIIWGNSLGTIGSYAFYGCSSLTTLSIPNSVKTIGEGAFRDCSNLTSVTLPNALTLIPDGLFRGCSKLPSINIPNSVTKINGGSQYLAGGAFHDCTQLSSVSMGNVSWIGDNVFYNCSNLNSITCAACTPPVIGSISTTFYNVPATANIYVLSGTETAYSNSDWGSKFTNFSGSATAVPVPVPTNVKVTKVGKITWEGTAERYAVYRDGQKLANSSVTSYTDGNTYQGNTYCYQVMAISGGCESALSDTVCVTIGIDPPTNVTVRQQLDNSFLITWESDAEQYIIYRNNNDIAIVSTTTYTDHNLISGATYCYQIKAIMGGRESPLSDEVCQTYIEGYITSVTNISGVPAQAAAGTPLTLTGTVSPSDATFQDIIFSVKDAGTTGASINGNILTAAAEGTVTVTATIANGKAIGEDYTQDFNIEVKPVGIVSATLNNQLRVYPNPTTGQLTIECRDVINHVSTVEIYSVVGQCVYTSPNPSKRGEHTTPNFVEGEKAPSPLERAGGEVIIDISHLSNGMYFLKVGNQVVKFVKE